MPSRASPRRSKKRPGSPVELERPSDASHGDYATNVALRLAPQRRQSPRELAQELADARLVEPARRACGGRGAGVREPLGRARVVPRRARGDPRGGKRLRGRLGCAARALPGRGRLGEPDRPDHRRSGAERRVRRLGRAAARRSPATTSSASTTTTTRARRWTASASRSKQCGGARSRRRTATGATTSTSSPRRRRRPGAEDARADRGVARAVPHPLRLVGAPERPRESAAGDPPEGSTRTRRTARSGRGRRRTATRTTA